MKIVLLVLAISLGVTITIIVSKSKFPGRSIAQTLGLILVGTSVIVLLVGIVFPDYVAVSWSHTVMLVSVVCVRLRTLKFFSMSKTLPLLAAAIPSVLACMIFERFPRYSASMTNTAELDPVAANAIENPLLVLVVILAHSLLSISILKSVRLVRVPQKVYIGAVVIVLLTALGEFGLYSYSSSGTVPHGSPQMWVVFNVEHLCAVLVVLGATGTGSAMIITATRPEDEIVDGTGLDAR